MIELLERAARADPDRVAIVTDEYELTYVALLERARLVAAALRQRGIDRVALRDTDAATVAALLAGASLAGAELCQYPPSANAGEIADLAARFDHALIVSREPSDGVPSLHPDELAAAGVPPTGRPERRPLLVLTTGTTGTPRGVCHDWSRLLRATARIGDAAGQRWLLAYGLHQFAGLQILLHVFAAGATLVAPAPRRPREGLQAMRRHGVGYASATPTYWRFLLAELRADGGPVPALRQITLGGEAVPGPLLAELRRTFPHAHVSQVYAASEFGSSGSVRDGRHGLSVEVLHRGEDADVAMKVVDGELWVRSRVGMLGYYGESPQADPDGWRPTGDLVEVTADRVLFRGRSSDVINVGGVKVHPLPVEERVAAVPGVALARVYGRPNALTGAIVAVDVVLEPGAVGSAVAAGIRAACGDLLAAARPRSIKFVDSVATAGDKIVRRSP